MHGSRALTALPEDLDLISSTHMVTQNHVATTIPGDLMPSGGLQGHQACTRYTDITNIHTYKVNKNLKNFYSIKKKKHILTFMYVCIPMSYSVQVKLREQLQESFFSCRKGFGSKHLYTKSSCWPSILTGLRHLTCITYIKLDDE